MVKDVALLLLGEEWRLLDHGNGTLDRLRPPALVGPEHHAASKARLYDPLEVAVERRPRQGEDDDADVDVYLGVIVEEREEVVEERVPRVHDVEAEAGVAHEHLLQRQRADQPSPRTVPRVGLAGPTEAEVDANGNVERFRHDP